MCGCGHSLMIKELPHNITSIGFKPHLHDSTPSLDPKKKEEKINYMKNMKKLLSQKYFCQNLNIRIT